MGENVLVTRVEDQQLVEEYLDGRSEDAFRSLYRAHSPYLYGLVLRLCGGRGTEAEEVLQEAWIRAARRLDSFRWNSALRTWVGGILINCWREFQKRQERRNRPLVLVDGGSQRATQEERLDLTRLVDALPDHQREVLVLFHLQGYTHDEIANILGIASGTSKSRLFEARRTLRDQLDTDTGTSGGLG